MYHHSNNLHPDSSSPSSASSTSGFRSNHSHHLSTSSSANDSSHFPPYGMADHSSSALNFISGPASSSPVNGTPGSNLSSSGSGTSSGSHSISSNSTDAASLSTNNSSTITEYGGAPTYPAQLYNNGAPAPSNDDSKSTLWMGELDPWLDEAAIRKIWSNFGENVNVKLIRDKFTGSNAGYCFVEFSSPAAAANALMLNGQLIPNSQRVIKLNWASGGGLSDKRDDKGPEYSIFVGDLTPEVTEFQLLQLFQTRYQSAKSAKIMTDPQTNASRGYGFVRFTDESEMQRTLTEMQGFYCGPRPMRISTATPKSKTSSSGTASTPQALGNVSSNATVAAAAGGNSLLMAPNVAGGSALVAPQNGFIAAQQQSKQIPAQLPQQFTQSIAAQSVNNPSGFYGVGAPSGGMLNQHNDPNNTTVFVGGLSSTVTEDELRHYFSGFGDITYVKIPTGKGCGFVQYVQRQSAEAAITQMQGYPIGNSRVRLSWGRSQNSANGGNNGLMNNSSANAMALNTPPLNATSAQSVGGAHHLGNFPNHYTLASSQPYRAAPPSVVYPQMAATPQAQQYNPFGSLNPQAVHMHPPPLMSQQQQQQQLQPDATGNIANAANNSGLFMGGVPPHIGPGPGAGSGSLVSAVPGQDPSEPIPVARLNELYLAARDGRLDRVEGDGRGYHGVYAQ